MDKEFLEDMKHIEQLEEILVIRTAEVLVLKAFIEEKGLTAEYKARLEQARAKASN